MEMESHRQKLSRYVITTSCAAALGGLLFGFDTAVISGAIGFLTTDFNLTTAQVGLVTSCILIGCMIGVAIGGTLSDHYGRKRTLMLSAIIFAVSSLFAALAQGLVSLIFWRTLAGIGIGLTSLITPIYIAEIAPPKVRGRLVSLNQLAITIGILIAYLSNALISNHSAAWNVSYGWRWMIGVCLVPSILFILALIPAAESPRWLHLQNKDTQALAILAKVYQSKSFATKELQSMKDKEEEVHSAASFKDLFKAPWFMVLVIGIMLCLFQQFSGSNAIMYYAPEIFKGAGYGQNASMIATVLIGLINMVITIAAIYLVDRIGRKKLLGWGAFAMSICLFVIAICFFMKASPIITLVFILLAIASYAISMAPVTWVVISEIYPSHIRARAMSICTVFLWLGDFVLSDTFPMLTASVGSGTTFLLYAVITMLAAIFVWRLLPETKGKTLEEIELFWQSRKK